ncbi:DUF1800 domain-containing protein [Xylophilus sp. GOD-11R]|uniref:DUF1800 domain-containing protein n=1 Tax=Xylophilus sp. GOD-11R TaxID=3089814 RepID=UPI00298C86C6|nr:DUF1800 domain-containing protein [Xylophilus sp. GOD-11R]WPB55972.1 DUF1800 domain-containing protein [Xylophilus sp. GOD-11R]
MNYTESASCPAPADASESQKPSTVPPSVAEPRRTRTWLAASIASASAALQACGGGGEDSPSSSSAGVSSASSTGTSATNSSVSVSGQAVIAATDAAGGTAGPLGQSRTYVNPGNDFDAVRFLLQAQFSASESEIASVRTLGYAGWLAMQFNTPPGLTAWDWLEQKGYSSTDVGAYYSTYPADMAIWWQLVNSPDTLRKRVALALSEIFVVSTTGISVVWPGQTMAAWWDMLSSNAFGNFRKLLEDVTLHPAMGNYLSMRGSLKENAAGRHPDENYAREVMQLMTIGLVKLNLDGTVDMSTGAAVDTYTQSDVSNLARVFSGYNVDMTGNVTLNVPGIYPIPSPTHTRLPMVLNASYHSTLDVNFLGNFISGRTEGNAQRKMVLDILFNHANVAPFISKQLIQRLVTSNPTPGYVARIAAVFQDNGKGVRGDIGAVVAAILLDQEARSPDGLSSPTFGKVREPMLRFVQWARSFKLTSTAGTWKLSDFSNPSQLGQSPLRAGSVFNFFRPGYVPPLTAIASNGLVAPEFQILNETSVSAYINFMQTTIRYGIYVRQPAVPQMPSSGASAYDMTADYSAELALVTDAAALMGRLNLILAGGQISATSIANMVAALNATPITATSTAESKLDRIAAAVLMTMASPEYLVQK